MSNHINNMPKCSSHRIKWLDSCKGFGVILVVIGHIASGYINAQYFPQQAPMLQTIQNLIYSFHMCLFFLISGFTFYKSYIEKYEEKKARLHRQLINIVWVYFLFSIVMWIFKNIFRGAVTNPLTLLDLALIPIKPITIYWYLWVLFFLYIIFITLNVIKLKPKHILFLSFAIGMIGSCLLFFDIIYDIAEILYYSFPFCLGTILALLHTKGCKTNTKLFVISGIITIITFTCIISFDITPATIPIISLIFGVTISLFIFTLCRVVFKKIHLSLFEIVGKYSLEIYVIHCFITTGNRTLLPILGINDFYINIFINLSMAVFLPIAFAFITKKLHIYNIIFKPANIFYRKASTKAI